MEPAARRAVWQAAACVTVPPAAAKTEAVKLAIGGMACSSCSTGERAAVPPVQLGFTAPWLPCNLQAPGSLLRCAMRCGGCWAAAGFAAFFHFEANPLAASAPACPPAAVEAALRRVRGVVAATVSLTLEQVGAQPASFFLGVWRQARQQCSLPSACAEPAQLLPQSITRTWHGLRSALHCRCD